ncbi:MAG: prephenate dehydrogenase [Gemmiger sp.]|nr:prephenate dehydrogenase [Gemmiger sp.]
MMQDNTKNYENGEKQKTWLIVGLGLLGGKYAQVLSGKGYRVTGIDCDAATLRFAQERAYIRAGALPGSEDFTTLVQQADYLVFGLYPTAFLDWIKQYGQLLHPGVLFTDVSGVKRGLVEPIQAMLPAGVEFIASHPMAGRETSGITHSAEVAFAPANFIITPTEKNTPAAIAWCRALAETLGFCRITTLSVAEHDRMIGYVSQLCHAIAVGLMCASDNTDLACYTGDSVRDLTRIARINDKMWAELFLWNKDNLIGEIDMFEAALTQLRTRLAEGDRAGLEEMFRLSTARRAAFDQKEP